MIGQAQEFSRVFLDWRRGWVFGGGCGEVAFVVDHERAGHGCEQADVEMELAVRGVFSGL